MAIVIPLSTYWYVMVSKTIRRCWNHAHRWRWSRKHTTQASRAHHHASSSSSPSGFSASLGLAAGAAVLYHCYQSSHTALCAGAAETTQTAPPIRERTEQRRSFIGDVVPFKPSDEISVLSLDQLKEMFSPLSATDKASAPLEYPSYSYAHNLPLLFTANSSSSLHQTLETRLRSAQDVICQHVLNLEGGASLFREDVTIRGDGGGIARVLMNGSVFQKGGVNTSFAAARLPFSKLRDMQTDHEQINSIIAQNEWNKKQRSSTGDDSIPVFNDTDMVTRFTASLSLVLHPVNPHAPTSHANYRYFEFLLPNGQQVWWVGGGSDLTPTYVRDTEAQHFHSVLKSVCDHYDNSYYPRFKKWCDKYFYIKHRSETGGETRGVGGIFFDDLHSSSQSHYLSFITDLARSFSASYFPLVIQNANRNFTPAEYRFQQQRRSRYVEFNLMYDKGTSFGLAQPNARPEAILMSLPLTCRFEYKPDIQSGSEEEYTMSVLKQPKEWIE